MSVLNDKSTQQLKERGIRLRQIRELMGMTQHQFAENCQVSESTLRQYETGRMAGLTDNAARKIINQLKNIVYCTFEWLTTGVGDSPVLKNAAVEFFSHTQLLVREKELIQTEIDLFLENALNPIILKVQDDAMEPVYLKGDIVGGNRYVSEDINLYLGKLVIVQTQDNKLVLRKLTSSDQTGLYSLYTLNPHSQIAEPVLLDKKIICVAPISRIWRISALNSE